MTSFALVSATDLIERIERHYPALRTSIFVGDTGAVSRMLAGEQLDVAIVSEAHVPGHAETGSDPARTVSGGLRMQVSRSRARRISPSDLSSLHLLISPPTARLHETVLKVGSPDARDAGAREPSLRRMPWHSQQLLAGQRRAEIGVVLADNRQGALGLVVVQPPITRPAAFA